ncbi:MAG: hypothetical protein EPN14_00565 [Gallionella sp.]|nr:MAG: hypothetical protein EPN14_00565 [Gallionella sp.]
MSNLIDAAQRIGMGYPGGIPALAGRMGKHVRVLQAKLSPINDTHHLSLMEALEIQLMTGKADVLHAMATELGFVAVPLPVPGASSGDLLRSVTRMMAEVGDYAREVERALGDGRVSDNERRRLAKELTEAVQALVHVQSLVLGSGE